jgi:hypothetical protein
MNQEEKVQKLKSVMPIEARESVEGALDWLVSRGIVSEKTFQHIDILDKFKSEYSQRGCPGRSTVSTAHRARVSDRTVYRIRGKFGR